MPRSFSHRWAHFVVGHWAWIITAWIAIAVGGWWVAPSWNDVAYDGDFAYLPAEMTSVAGGRLLDEAFPGERSRSQIVFVLGREGDELTKRDNIVGFDLLRRLYHRLGEVSWQRAINYGYESGPVEEGSPAQHWIQLAQEAFTRSIATDEQFYQAIAADLPDDPPTLREPRMAIAYWDRGKLLESLGAPAEDVAADLEAALILKPGLPDVVQPIAERDLSRWDSMLDVLSWDDPVIGERLRKDGAMLTVMQLSSELAATRNIKTVEAAEELIDEVLGYSLQYTQPGLQLLMTGSAAIGGETLLASRDAIRYTEWFTVAMILLILAGVYRAPFLVAIPIISIGLAVVSAMSLVALLTQWSMTGVIPGLDLRVFTTSRIFVVVILFGAGTDYCLFLVARLREEAAHAEWPLACRRALTGVSGALMGSAMTTVVGLATLWIAEFGKFHYSGPIIAICLLVGLAVCMTFTPAVLRMLGPRVFWPSRVTVDTNSPGLSLSKPRSKGTGSSVWNWIALFITRHPASSLAVGVLLLTVPAMYGYRQEGSVTYDLSSQLNHSAMSRRGLRLLSEHFAIGEINPVTVLVLRDEEASREELQRDVKELRELLYAVPGVRAVRTANDPMGDFPPDREMGLLRGDAWRRRALRNHRLAEGYFFSSRPAYENRLARLDVIVRGDPFAIKTASEVSRIQSALQQAVQDDASAWQGSQVLLTGTTPSIIDLRTVTLRDNQRIKIAVVAAVFLVLVLVIRRIWLCLYLIATVLISYYATLGLTTLFFRFAYGSDYVGLDWKLPLFLFVILVAVGQDYNVYLVTRIIEEQRRLGWLAGVRRAVARTGGIITACGLVMAATFFSMTASAWFPQLAEWLGMDLDGGRRTLRGIVELGFALGLGVLIDTFYVRTILVPSFVALLGKRHSRTKPA